MDLLHGVPSATDLAEEPLPAPPTLQVLRSLCKLLACLTSARYAARAFRLRVGLPP